MTAFNGDSLMQSLWTKFLSIENIQNERKHLVDDFQNLWHLNPPVTEEELDIAFLEKLMPNSRRPKSSIKQPQFKIEIQKKLDLIKKNRIRQIQQKGRAALTPQRRPTLTPSAQPPSTKNDPATPQNADILQGSRLAGIARLSTTSVNLGKSSNPVSSRWSVPKPPSVLQPSAHTEPIKAMAGRGASSSRSSTSNIRVPTTKGEEVVNSPIPTASPQVRPFDQNISPSKSDSIDDQYLTLLSKISGIAPGNPEETNRYKDAFTKFTRYVRHKPEVYKNNPERGFLSRDELPKHLEPYSHVSQKLKLDFENVDQICTTVFLNRFSRYLDPDYPSYQAVFDENHRAGQLTQESSEKLWLKIKKYPDSDNLVYLFSRFMQYATMDPVNESGYEKYEVQTKHADSDEIKSQWERELLLAGLSPNLLPLRDMPDLHFDNWLWVFDEDFLKIFDESSKNQQNGPKKKYCRVPLAGAYLEEVEKRLKSVQGRARESLSRYIQYVSLDPWMDSTTENIYRDIMFGTTDRWRFLPGIVLKEKDKRDKFVTAWEHLLNSKGLLSQIPPACVVHKDSNYRSLALPNDIDVLFSVDFVRIVADKLLGQQYYTYDAEELGLVQQGRLRKSATPHHSSNQNEVRGEIDMRVEFKNQIPSITERQRQSLSSDASRQRLEQYDKKYAIPRSINYSEIVEKICNYVTINQDLFAGAAFASTLQNLGLPPHMRPYPEIANKYKLNFENWDKLLEKTFLDRFWRYLDPEYLNYDAKFDENMRAIHLKIETAGKILGRYDFDIVEQLQKQLAPFFCYTRMNPVNIHGYEKLEVQVLKDPNNKMEVVSEWDEELSKLGLPSTLLPLRDMPQLHFDNWVWVYDFDFVAEFDEISRKQHTRPPTDFCQWKLPEEKFASILARLSSVEDDTKRNALYRYIMYVAMDPWMTEKIEEELKNHMCGSPDRWRFLPGILTDTFDMTNKRKTAWRIIMESKGCADIPPVCSVLKQITDFYAELAFPDDENKIFDDEFWKIANKFLPLESFGEDYQQWLDNSRGFGDLEDDYYDFETASQNEFSFVSSPSEQPIPNTFTMVPVLPKATDDTQRLWYPIFERLISLNENVYDDALFDEIGARIINQDNDWKQTYELLLVNIRQYNWPLAVELIETYAESDRRLNEREMQILYDERILRISKRFGLSVDVVHECAEALELLAQTWADIDNLAPRWASAAPLNCIRNDFLYGEVAIESTVSGLTTAPAIDLVLFAAVQSKACNDPGNTDKVYEIFDQDRDGYATVADFQRVAKAFGVQVPDTDWDALMKYVDEDGVRKMDRAEFGLRVAPDW